MYICQISLSRYRNQLKKQLCNNISPNYIIIPIDCLMDKVLFTADIPYIYIMKLLLRHVERVRNNGTCVE